MTKKSLAFLLDIDGTLVDSVYNHIDAWEKAFSSNGIYIPKSDIHKLIGMGADKLIPTAIGSREAQRLGSKINELHGKFFGEEIDKINLLPFAREFIDKAKSNGFEVYLVSSAKGYEIEKYTKMLADDFVVVSSDDVEKTKPDPEIFIKALDKAQIKADKAIVIGDSIWDIKASVKLNIKSVAVLTGGFCPEELEKAGASIVLKNLKEAVSRFKEIKDLLV